MKRDEVVEVEKEIYIHSLDIDKHIIEHLRDNCIRPFVAYLYYQQDTGGFGRKATKNMVEYYISYIADHIRKHITNAESLFDHFIFEDNSDDDIRDNIVSYYNKFISIVDPFWKDSEEKYHRIDTIALELMFNELTCLAELRPSSFSEFNPLSFKLGIEKSEQTNCEAQCFSHTTELNEQIRLPQEIMFGKIFPHLTLLDLYSFAQVSTSLCKLIKSYLNTDFYEHNIFYAHTATAFKVEVHNRKNSQFIFETILPEQKDLQVCINAMEKSSSLKIYPSLYIALEAAYPLIEGSHSVFYEGEIYQHGIIVVHYYGHDSGLNWKSHDTVFNPKALGGMYQKAKRTVSLTSASIPRAQYKLLAIAAIRTDSGFASYSNLGFFNKATHNNDKLSALSRAKKHDDPKDDSGKKCHLM